MQIDKKNGSEDSWPTENLRSLEPVTGKKYNVSTRITVFLMFEFLLFFTLLACLIFLSTVTYAGSVSGADFLVPFLIALLAAPFVFAYIIHLADNIFKYMGFKKDIWRDSIIAVIVAVSIGVAISYYFVHKYLFFP